MADTYDDDIIDLTDLMEEGEPEKKQRRADQTATEKTPAREPESFDLGKEISLEDEFALDAEPAPAPEEETASETPASKDEEPAEPTPAGKPLKGRSDFDDLLKESGGSADELPDFSAPDDFSPGEPAAKEERPAPSKTRASSGVSPVFDAFFKETIEDVKLEAGVKASIPLPDKGKNMLEEMLERDEGFEREEAAPAIAPEEVSAPEVLHEPPVAAEEIMTPPAIDEIQAPSATEEAAAVPVMGEAVAPPVIPAAPPVAEAPLAAPAQVIGAALRQEMEAKVQAAAGELKAEVPALLEGIVRPVMDDLIKQITQTTREILPGIVEKIIREEIEKLKKLD
jgi:hypothetical protein